jgi:hypothetical protein
MTGRRTAGVLSAGLLAALSAGGAAALLATMPQLPDATSFAAADRWWIEVGTAAAAMTLVQLAAVGLAAWITAAALVDLAARLHPTGLLLEIRRLVCRPMLSRLVGGAVLLTATGPTALAGADDSIPADRGAPDGSDRTGEPVPDDLVLIDIGPADDTADDDAAAAEAVLLIDIGSVPGQEHPGQDGATSPPLGDPSEEAVATHDDETWTVQRGDHLWRIADETVVDRGGEATEANVAAYWRRLIEANPEAVGDDPDLIHPGQVVRLPE